MCRTERGEMALEGFEQFEQEGLSELDSTATQMHEVFCSFTKAGFTEDQALKLCAILLNTPEETEE